MIGPGTTVSTTCKTNSQPTIDSPEREDDTLQSALAVITSSGKLLKGAVGKVPRGRRLCVTVPRSPT